MDSMDASPEARQKHSHEPPYRVLKEGDGEIPDKVPGSQILFYERKIISQGSNAIVHHGKFGDDKIGFRPAAIKKFQRKDVKLFENELRIWKEIDESNIHSVNVIKMFGYVEWTTFLFIAIEKAHTDLRNMIVQMRKKISNDITSSQLKQLVGYVHDASKGLNWLHSKDIIHRDIKPDNILICVHSMNGKDIETAKLTDFGVSRIMSDSMGTETSVEGTDDWLAPEVLEAKVAGRSLFNAKPQDIFSLGLTAHFTLSLGDHPFGYRETGGGIVGANILNAEFPPARLPHPHYMANNLIQRMIQRTAAIRPEITSVLKHPLFWNWKTSLHFIAEFASIFGEKHADGTEDFRAKLDQHFKCWYEENVMSEYVENEAAKFDWKSKLDYGKLEAFTKRKSYQESSKDMMEKYDGESLMRLVDFIRDKCMHPGDMMDKLKEVEHFGEDGVFNKEKYAEYFLQTFPYLLLFLVEVYDKHSNTYADLRQLRHYFD